MSSREIDGGILVVIPTYNERESLPGVLARLREAVPEAHVLVVDDGSPDGTGEWTAEQAAADPQVHLLQRSEKNGLGPAYLAGFAWGLERGAEVLVEMDADGSHRPEQLPRLLDVLDAEPEVGLVIGSRWVPGGAVHDWAPHRQALSRGANLYVRCALGLAVRDATAGFRAYRAPLLQCLVGGRIASQGYCFQVDMTRKAAQRGARITEVPIDFDERTLGDSKMDAAIIREALVRVTCWGLQHWVGTLLRGGKLLR